MELRYGIEGEVLLARAGTFEPLWHDDLDFGELNALLETIPTADVAREGLRREGPHPSVLPYVVEGYDVPAPGDAGLAVGRLPKGLEIRTPVCGSIREALELYGVLFERLQAALHPRGLVPVHVSHHPRETSFEGPRNSRREDWWRWQMAAMTTYGPDVNLSLDAGGFARLDLTDLERKFDHYAPAMVAFSLDAPIYGGRLWRVGAAPPDREGEVTAWEDAEREAGIGKSVRTYLRSLHAPPMLILPHEGWRLEFKAFDSTSSLADLENDLLLFAAVLLDGRLAHRDTPAGRVRALRQVAVRGWRADDVRERAEEILAAAERTLPEHGLDAEPLERYRRRVELGWVPADETVARFRREGSVEGVLRRSAGLVREDPLEAASLQAGALA